MNRPQPSSYRRPAGELSERVNRWLIRICAALLVVVAVHYVFTLANVPAYVRLALRGEVPTKALNANTVLSQAMLEAHAARRGMPLAVYLAYSLGLNALVAVGFWTAGALVVRRASDDWFRWFTALVLVFFPTGDTWQIGAAVHPVAAAYFEVLSLLWPCFLLFIFLFPDGRAVPRWARWPIAGFFVAHLALQALGFLAGLPGQPVPLPAGIERFFVIVAIEFPILLFCQVYRYICVADRVMRKQIQWMVAVLALFAVSGVLLSLLGGSNASNDQGYAADLDYISGLLLPAAVVIAILRYRLWDIDVIVRRTLIYSTLTAVLALGYLGSVLLLQSLLQALTGRSQDQLVAVVSTLGIAALFVPLRARVQSVIDHRFYRRKYDAAKTIAAFGNAMRDEVEINNLTNRLIETVEAAMQPASVGLWVKPDARRGNRETA